LNHKEASRISSAEADLVRRDPGIPGLAVVFDPEVFVATLREAAPEVDLRSAQITYLRYKPRNYCRVAYRLNVAGEELDVDVRACRPEDMASWLRQREPASVVGTWGRGHMVHLVLESCAVLVSAFPNDLKLPCLPELTDAQERKRLLSELLPDRADLWDSALRCLRYRPERRYVAELRPANGTRALLKSYTARAYLRGKRNARAFHSRDRVRVARLLGSSDSRCLLAFEWLPGRLLLDSCVAPEVDRQAVMAAGSALGALHAQDPGGLECWSREAEAADLVSLSAEVGFICPHLSQRADDLSRRLATRLAGAPAVHTAVHGDFSANQVLVDRQEAAIIDLDWAGYGDPAGDLGNFIAQAERFALRGKLSPSRVELLRDLLLEGYGRATHRPLPERIGLYTAVEVFRRTRFPFRTREADWPQRTESLLDRCEAILNTLS
jgi:aminoglycoside phosphotransferase (APT) family kinase protein